MFPHSHSLSLSLSLSQILTFFFFSQSARQTGDVEVCLIDHPYYMIYGSTLAFLIPLVIMLVSYWRTTRLLREQAAALQAAAASTGPPA